MINTILSRRGTLVRVACAISLLAGLAVPAGAYAGVADDNVFALAPGLAPIQQTGDLNAGLDNVDRFFVDLAEDQVLTLDLSGTPAYMDFDLSLYSPDVATADPGKEEFYLVTRSKAPDTATESIAYLVPPGGDGRYFVEVSSQGGAIGAYVLDWALDSGVGDAVRLSGTDRYATSAAASRSSFTTSTAVVIASGANFPDALSAAGLAGALGAPVLLVPPTAAADDARMAALYSEITRLGAKDAYVIGGSSAVGDAVYSQIESWVASLERIPGSTRYETARNVALKIDEINGSASTAAFVVRGDSFADALAVSPFAYSQAMPILLTPSGTLDGFSKSYLDTYNIAGVYIAGGTGAVSTAVASALDALNSGTTDVVRMDGATRYQTAAHVASDGIDRGWGDWSRVGLATGANFPDALSGGAALGTRGGALLLTAGTELSAPASDAIDANAGPGCMAIVLGGASAVSDSVMDSVRALLP